MSYIPGVGAGGRSCTELTRLPSERITYNALGALKMVGARRLAPAVARSYGGAGVQGCLILSQVGLLFPVNHAPMKLASLTGFAPVISCMRGRHVGWTTPQGQEMVRAKGFAPLA